MTHKTKTPENWTPLFFELDRKGAPVSADDDKEDKEKNAENPL
jgi:hypothetical protein